MPRILVGDQATPQKVQPLTAALRQGLDLTTESSKYFIREEEVPRAGKCAWLRKSEPAGTGLIHAPRAFSYWCKGNRHRGRIDKCRQIAYGDSLSLSPCCIAREPFVERDFMTKSRNTSIAGEIHLL